MSLVQASRSRIRITACERADVAAREGKGEPRGKAGSLKRDTLKAAHAAGDYGGAKALGELGNR
eukprot:129507-Pleurochrysis_carterae.AAC.1